MTRAEKLKEVFGIDISKEEIVFCPNNCESCSEKPSFGCARRWWEKSM